MEHWPEVKKLANFAHKWGESSLNCTLKKTDLSKIIQSKKFARLGKISKENTLTRIGLQTKNSHVIVGMNYDLLQVNHESIIDLIVHIKDHCRLLSSYGLSNICDIWSRMILWETNPFSMLQLIVLWTYLTLYIPITLSLFKQRPPNLKSLHVAKRF